MAVVWILKYLRSILLNQVICVQVVSKRICFFQTVEKHLWSNHKHCSISGKCLKNYGSYKITKDNTKLQLQPIICWNYIFVLIIYLTQAFRTSGNCKILPKI